jgi:hypothetical protein
VEELDEAGLPVELAELDRGSSADEVDAARGASFGNELAELRGALLEDELDKLLVAARRASFGDELAESRGELLDDELDAPKGALPMGREASSDTLAPIGAEGGWLTTRYPCLSTDDC